MAASPTRRDALLLAGASLLALATPAFAVVAPRLGPVALYKPAPPYNEKANAEADIRRGHARAKAENKRLLIDMGGNWCTDCLVLTAILDTPKAKAFVDAHFVTVNVDVGRFDKNLQIPRRYGVTLTGVPCVVVLDKAGKVINPGNDLTLANAASMTPQAVVDQLAAWAA